MNAPDVEYPILFARPQFDDVGLCGFEVEKNISIGNEAMKQTLPDFNKYPVEAKEQ